MNPLCDLIPLTEFFVLASADPFQSLVTLHCSALPGAFDGQGWAFVFLCLCYSLSIVTFGSIHILASGGIVFFFRAE